MDYADRFVHKAFTAEAARRKSIARQETASVKASPGDLSVARPWEGIDRALLARQLMAKFLDFLIRGHKDPPEDPYAYSLVRVKPRLPQLSRGATAELDN